MNITLLIVSLTALNVLMVLVSYAEDLLDRRVTMQVYPSEILESVVIRFGSYLGGRADWDTRMLAPYKAKPALYEQATIREILDEQLAGTPIRYEVRKKRLVISLPPAPRGYKSHVPHLSVP